MTYLQIKINGLGSAKKPRMVFKAISDRNPQLSYQSAVKVNFTLQGRLKEKGSDFLLSSFFLNVDDFVLF